MMLRRIHKGIFVRYNYGRLFNTTANLRAAEEINTNVVKPSNYPIGNESKQKIQSKLTKTNERFFNDSKFDSLKSLKSSLSKEIKDCLNDIQKEKHLKNILKEDQKIWNKSFNQLSKLIREQLDDGRIWERAQQFQKQEFELLRFIKLHHRDLLVLILSLNKLNNSQWSQLLCMENYTITDQIKYILNGSLKSILIETRNNVSSNQVANKKIEEHSKQLTIPPPNEWFPEANKMRRHIILHLGPTNSGKTYKALQKLIKCENGYYGGPLRLLAREIYDKFQNQGVVCNLLTGEEIIPGFDSMGNKSGLTCGTIEMIPLNKHFDIVVLDEIQMIADETRGSSWTNALLGVQAKEIHLCGEPSVLPLIKKVVAMTGDFLTVNNYDRLGKLVMQPKSINNNFKKLKKGDCLVAFSKRQILTLKLKVQKETNLKAAVIYGSLPPETRLQQAKLFNNGHYDILIASDAIGMGLNLNIDRVIFTTSLKFNGTESVPLTISTIKQIGGRAGRFKDHNIESTGFITAIDNRTLDDIRKGMQSDIPPINKMIAWPPDEIFFNLFINSPKSIKVSELLQLVNDDINAKEVDKTSIFQSPDVARLIERLITYEHMSHLNFTDKLLLCTAPMKNDPMVQKTFIKFCETIANKERKSLLDYGFPFDKLLDYQQILEGSKVELAEYESLYNIIMLFCWLSNKYPEYFIDRESAMEIKLLVELIIFEKIDRVRKNPYFRSYAFNYSEQSGRQEKNTKNKRVISEKKIIGKI